MDMELQTPCHSNNYHYHTLQRNRRRLIHHHRVILQGDESMGEPHWNEHLAPGFGRDFHRNMLAERRRAAAYIHCDICDSSLDNGDQLGLRRRWTLEMQSAQRARPLGVRLVILNEAAGNANGV